MAPTSVPLIASKGIASNSPNQPRIPGGTTPVHGRRTGQGDQEWLCSDEQAGAGMQEHSPVARHVMPAIIKRPVKKGPRAAAADQSRQRRGGPAQEYEVRTEAKLGAAPVVCGLQITIEV